MNPSQEPVDELLDEHLARMPEATRQQLAPAIAADAPDPWVRDVLRSYLRYFTRLFDLADESETAEPTLAEDLRRLAGTDPGADAEATIDLAEAVLAGRFRTRGLQFLGGRTPPHFGAYVWRRTEVRRFRVALPRAEPEEVTVHLMHDFVIRGWLHWKTYGSQGAGGWYQDGNADWEDGLYCVADRYTEPLEEDRTFGVSLLGHEAQHVADGRAYPGMSSVDLEYRAKLVELIGYDAVDDRLRFFLADRADDPTQPHPYAAHRIIEDLARRLFGEPATDEAWDGVDYAEIRRHAQELLDEDTARRARG